MLYLDTCLGVLLMGHGRGAYWHGSQLSIEEARRLVPYNNATSLQVTISIVAAMAWAIRHPDQGSREPDELGFRAILAMCRPYLGKMVGVYSDWPPCLTAIGRSRRIWTWTIPGNSRTSG